MRKLLLILIVIISAQISLSAQNTLPGIDVLLKYHTDILKGKRLGLLSNNAGRNSEGKLSAEVLATHPELNLSVIFAPEHGFYTTVAAGKEVANEKLFNTPVVSLYGRLKKPTKEILDKCDIVLVDLQDIGVRSYTYISTMYYVMQACAENSKQLIILDRPNPLNGNNIDGNNVEEAFSSFVSIVPVPYIHGLTIGEMAYMINNEGWLGKKADGTPLFCNMSVIKMENWKRDYYWEDTGLHWFPTSPHVPTSESVKGLAYLGIIGELGIVSIGVGTTRPFGYLGDPYLNCVGILDELPQNSIIRAEALEFSPIYGMYSGLNKPCQGYIIFFEEKGEFKPYTACMDLLFRLRKKNPKLFKYSDIKGKIPMFKKVTGTAKIMAGLLDNPDYDYKSLINKDVKEFEELRKKYLLYQ